MSGCKTSNAKPATPIAVFCQAPEKGAVKGSISNSLGDFRCGGFGESQESGNKAVCSQRLQATGFSFCVSSKYWSNPPAANSKGKVFCNPF